jgi:hypothetical protein
MTYLDYSQKFIDVGNSALAVSTEGPEAESLLELLETQLDNLIANGPCSPLHLEVVDDYLYATWTLHISWSALRNTCPDHDLPLLHDPVPKEFQ